MSRAALDDAVQRLAAALDAFEAAVARRKASEEIVRELEEDAHLLALDRSRLARELDEAKARAERLASTNGEAARRLDNAIAVIREVLTEATGKHASDPAHRGG